MLKLLIMMSKKAKIIQEVNKDNNSVFKAAIGGIVVIALGVLTFIAGNKDNKS